MSVLAWIAIALVGVPIAYAALCGTFLLFVRLPDETPFAALEDLLLLFSAPFIAAVIGFTALRRGR